jgi:transposase
MINVPWSKPGSGFTLLFEAMVLQLARVMPVSQIALLVGEHDTRIWRIVQRYVQIAIKQADYGEIKSVGIDETSSKKRHHYVTLFVDMDENRVVYVTPGKDASVIGTFKQVLQSRNIPSKQVEQVCADMSPAFRKGVQEQFPEAQLTFDRFHVMKLINEAVDKVRREEQSTEQVLKRSRYIWLRNPENLSTKQSDMLHSMSILNLKTGRAYRIKLALQNIYRHADNLDEATTMLRSWYSWAVRSRLDPIREFARTVKNHWSGILNYFDSRLTNGILEGTNSIVQTARARARGYRNVNNFITMIYLLGGKLELPVFSER